MLQNKISLKINLYNKLLGFLIKKGNKIKAKKIIDNAFLEVSKKTGHSLSFLLFKLFFKLNIFVESKTIRVKRSSFIVPFSINLKRRSYLIIKWFMKIIVENKKKISISQKIAEEIFLILKTPSSKVLKLRSLNNMQALSNRSNIHFRW
jgi:ribosomal protein S7